MQVVMRDANNARVNRLMGDEHGILIQGKIRMTRAHSDVGHG